MFARLSIYENVDLDLADKVKQFMETLETDPFGELPGYSGSMTLVDRDNARLVGIGFYASAGQAQGGRRAAHDDARVPRRPGPRHDPAGARHAPGHRRPVRDRPARLRPGHVPLVLPHPGMPVPSRRRTSRPTRWRGGRGGGGLGHASGRLTVGVRGERRERQRRLVRRTVRASAARFGRSRRVWPSPPRFGRSPPRFGRVWSLRRNYCDGVTTPPPNPPLTSRH